jgi:hypothetical protein
MNAATLPYQPSFTRTTMSTPDPTNAQQLLLLGEIKGIVQGLRDGQAAQDRRMANIETAATSMDARLRKVEVRSATFGAVSGGVMGVGMALLVEVLKDSVRRAGSGG